MNLAFFFFWSYHRCLSTDSVISVYGIRFKGSVCACFQAHFNLSIWQIFKQTPNNLLLPFFLSVCPPLCAWMHEMYFMFRYSTFRKMTWVTDLNSYSFYTIEILKAFRTLYPAPTRAQYSLSLFSLGPLLSELMEMK